MVLDHLVKQKSRCLSQEQDRFYSMDEAREWIKTQGKTQQSTDPEATVPVTEGAER
jgi:hypothetical protein